MFNPERIAGRGAVEDEPAADGGVRVRGRPRARVLRAGRGVEAGPAALHEDDDLVGGHVEVDREAGRRLVAADRARGRNRFPRHVGHDNRVARGDHDDAAVGTAATRACRAARSATVGRAGCATRATRTAAPPVPATSVVPVGAPANPRAARSTRAGGTRSSPVLPAVPPTSVGGVPPLLRASVLPDPPVLPRSLRAAFGPAVPPEPPCRRTRRCFAMSLGGAAAVAGASASSAFAAASGDQRRRRQTEHCGCVAVQPALLR
jgi:hypothetical protein